MCAVIPVAGQRTHGTSFLPLKVTSKVATPGEGGVCDCLVGVSAHWCICLQAARKLAIAEVTLESFESRLEAAESYVQLFTHCITSPDNLTFYYFASAAVGIDSSHMTASLSASCSRFSPSSNVVNGHVSTVWFMVCRSSQPEVDDWARLH